MGSRPDKERKIAKQLQGSGDQSVEDTRLPNEPDLSNGKQSPLGEYAGSTKNPIGGYSYQGSQVKGRFGEKLQAQARDSGGGRGVNQAKGSN